MAQDWQDGYYENKNLVDAVVASAIAAENIVTYDPVTGQIMDDATAITGMADMTYTEMTNLTAPQLLALDGMPLRLNDVHSNTTGAGGVYASRTASPAGFGQIGAPWHFDTLAEAVAAAAYIPNLRCTCADVGYGLVDLRWDGTSRIRPVGRYCVLAGGAYGTIASPTNTISAGTSGYFSIETPTFPAGLFDAGDRLILHARFRKNGTGGAGWLVSSIGTTGTASDSAILGLDIPNIDNSDIDVSVVCYIGSDTSYTTNNFFAPYYNPSGTVGNAPGAYDKSNNFNVASSMILSIAVGTKNAADSVDLLGYSFAWEA